MILLRQLEKIAEEKGYFPNYSLDLGKESAVQMPLLLQANP